MAMGLGNDDSSSVFLGPFFNADVFSRLLVLVVILIKKVLNYDFMIW